MRTLQLVALLAVSSWAVGCGREAKPPHSLQDLDGDGFPWPLDCDDSRPEVNPLAPDPPYDGVDSDCRGNDDFDADEDGVASDEHGGSDCDDTDATVAPGLDEIPDDGKDNDCDPSTPDGDLDGDGFSVPQDCDDGDPLIFPGAEESLFDLLDGDCDGDPNTTAWVVLPEEYVDVTGLGMAEIDGAIAIAVNALLVKGEGTEEDQVGAGLVLGINDESEVFETLFWHGQFDVDPMGGLDLEPLGDGAWLGAAYFSDFGRQSWTIAQELTSSGGGFGRAALEVGSGGEEAAPFVDVFIDREDGVWTLGCGGGSLVVVRPDGSSDKLATTNETACFFEPGVISDPPPVVCDELGCTTFDVHTLLPAEEQPRAAETWLGSAHRHGWLATWDTFGVKVDDGLEAHKIVVDVVLDAEVAGTPNEFLLSVVHSPGGSRQVTLMAGSLPGNFTSVIAPPILPDLGLWIPQKTSLLLTDDEIIILVSAEDPGSAGPTTRLALARYQR